MSEPAGWSMVCPQCGATNSLTATRCFLCQEPVRRNLATEGQPPLPAGSPAPNQKIPTGDLWIWPVLIAGSVAVWMGVDSEAPGLGNLLAIAMVLAFAIALTSTAKARAGGRPFSTGGKLVLFFGSAAASLLVVTLIVVIAAVASIIAIGQNCFSIK